MANKRPAETADHVGDKRSKPNSPQHAWSEAQDPLNLLGKPFQQMQAEFDQPQELKAAENAQFLDFIASQEVDKLEIQALQVSLEDSRQAAGEANDRCSELARMFQVERLKTEETRINADRCYRRQKGELANSGAETLDFKSEVRRLKDESGVMEQICSDDLHCLLEALSAMAKVKEVTKGIHLDNMGPFGVAHTELRTAWTSKVRELLLKHTAAQTFSEGSQERTVQYAGSEPPGSGWPLRR